MSPTTRRLVPVLLASTRRRSAIFLMIALVLASGAAACGVQDAQDKVEKARQVEEQVEKSQQGLEQRLQEAGQKVEEGQ